MTTMTPGVVPMPVFALDPWELEIIERYQQQFAPKCLPWWSLLCPTKRHAAMIAQLGQDAADQIFLELEAGRKKRSRR